jgi:hypothetical protein
LLFFDFWNSSPEDETALRDLFFWFESISRPELPFPSSPPPMTARFFIDDDVNYLTLLTRLQEIEVTVPRTYHTESLGAELTTF